MDENAIEALRLANRAVMSYVDGTPLETQVELSKVAIKSLNEAAHDLPKGTYELAWAVRELMLAHVKRVEATRAKVIKEFVEGP